MSSRTSQRLALAALGLVAIGTTLVLRPHRPTASFERGQMPACDSGPVRQLLKQTLEQPNPEVDDFHVLKLAGVSDVSTAFTPEEMKARPERRRCVADAYTNVGHGLIVFQIDWIDAAKNDLYLETVASTF